MRETGNEKRETRSAGNFRSNGVSLEPLACAPRASRQSGLSACDAQAGESRFPFPDHRVPCPTSRVPPQRGFTLIEILVVVLLIGITVSLVSLRLGHDPKKLAEDEARRFAALLEHVRDESIQTGTVFAIELDADGRGYRFLSPAPKWTPVKRDSVLRPRALAEPLRTTLDVPGSPPGAPAWIFLTPAGEISPFRFRVKLPGQATAYLVQLDANQTPRVSADAG